MIPYTLSAAETESLTSDPHAPVSSAIRWFALAINMSIWARNSAFRVGSICEFETFARTRSKRATRLRRYFRFLTSICRETAETHRSDIQRPRLCESEVATASSPERERSSDFPRSFSSSRPFRSSEPRPLLDEAKAVQAYESSYEYAPAVVTAYVAMTSSDVPAMTMAEPETSAFSLLLIQRRVSSKPAIINHSTFRQ